VTGRKRAEEQLGKSEQRFRHFVENLHDVVYALDRFGNFLYVSPAIEQISMYTPEELVGRSFGDFVHPDDLPAIAEKFGVILTGVNGQLEYRVFDKDGAERWVHASIAPTIEDGEIVGVTGVFSEITARKRTLEALYESEARYRELVEMSPDSIVVHQDGKIVFANEASLRLVGAKTPAEIL